MDLSEEDILDPTPDIHALFVHYNNVYFNGALDSVSVEWSSGRMTSCAGTCERAVGGAVIKLSRPLLALRPTRDLKDTLLHEMIHAYNFVRGVRDYDAAGHGSEFQRMMAEINSSTATDHQRPPGGYQITVYHSMHDEVNHYRQHHWVCERCGDEVRRAMNRPPQEADCMHRAGAACTDARCRWHMHLRYCGGGYIKTKEPDGYGDQRRKKRRKGDDGVPDAAKQPGVSDSRSRPITSFFPRLSAPDQQGDNEPIPAIDAILKASKKEGLRGNGSSGPGEIGMLQEANERRRLLAEAAMRRMQPGPRAALSSEDQPSDSADLKTTDQDIKETGWAASCPACGQEVHAADEHHGNVSLNQHLDQCLTT